MKKKTKSVKKARTAKAEKKTTVKNTCFRCQRTFPSRKALKSHSKAHLNALREMEMLESGHVPVETKLGGEFRGRNKIIVASS